MYLLLKCSLSSSATREYDRITTQEDFYYRWLSTFKFSTFTFSLRRHQQNKKPPWQLRTLAGCPKVRGDLSSSTWTWGSRRSRGSASPPAPPPTITRMAKAATTRPTESKVSRQEKEQLLNCFLRTVFLAHSCHCLNLIEGAPFLFSHFLSWKWWLWAFFVS